MTKLISRLVENKIPIGYEVDDDGFVYTVLDRCLYTEAIFMALIESGYKYYSYNPDEIEDASSKKIIELPVKEIEIDEDERYAIEEMASYAMSDAECSKYYAFKNDITIEFKAAEDITITTREELINYLRTAGRLIDQNGFSSDFRPLNSFVAKEALFSCDELKSNDEYRVLLEVINKRHKLRDWGSYSELINWLYKKGVLNTHTPTYIEFLNAYYSWGVDGIKDSCIDVKVRQNVDASFEFKGEPEPRGNHLLNRTQKLILWDSNNKAHYLRDETDMSDIQEYNRERIAFNDVGTLFKAKRASQEAWGKPFKVLSAYVTNVSDRVYYKFLTENMYSYEFRVTHDKWVLFSGEFTVISGYNFSVGSISRGISFTLDKLQNVNDYRMFNLALSKAQNLLKDRHTKVPVKSTYDMLIQEGLSPKAAINMMAVDIHQRTDYKSTQMHKDYLGKRPDYTDAFDKYCSPIPANVLQRYNVDQTTIESIDEFIDLATDYDDISDMQENLNFKLTGQAALLNNISILAGGVNTEVDPRKYLEDITFVRACLNDEVTINAFGDGKTEDEEGSLLNLMEIIITCTYSQVGNFASFSEYSDYISNFEDIAPFDFDKTFRKRNKAYIGYRKDLSYVRAMRAYGSWAWMYCTKIFREISNAACSEQRHYMMEVIIVTNDDKKQIREQLRAAIIKSADSDDALTSEEKESVKNESYYIASKLFFQILGDDKEELRIGNVISIDLPVDNSNSITIKLPDYIYSNIKSFNVSENIRYITLNDYCDFEFEYKEGAGFAFSMYMVNANVNPWYVTPKKGYAINTYNFCVNYHEIERFSNYSDGWKNNLEAVGGKVHYALSKIGPKSFIPDMTETMELNGDIKLDKDILEFFLDSNQQEMIQNYYKRWKISADDAKASGCVLKTMRMKQDIQLYNIARYYGQEMTEDVITDVNSEIKTTNYIASVEPMAASEKVVEQFVLKGSSITKRIFNVLDYKYSDVLKWEKLLSGNFAPVRIVFMNSWSMVLTEAGENPQIVGFDNLNAEVLEKMSDSNICYQLSDRQFYFKAINGDYVLEV